MPWVPQPTPMLTLLLAQPAEAHLAGSAPDLTRYILVVVVLIVALVGIAYGFRRLIAGSLKSRASTRSLAVIDVLPLGGKRQLTVVRCYDRTFALGLGEKHVTFVAELDPILTAKTGNSPPTDPGRTQDFEGLLDLARSRLTRTRTSKELVR